MKKKILITTSSFGVHDDQLIPEIESAGYSVILNPYKRKLTESEITDLINKYQPVGMIAGVEPLSRGVLLHANDLKVISRAGIGMDSVDLEAAQELGIKVTNTPDAPTIPVAELTIGMILSLLRRIHVADAAIRNKQWLRPMGNLLKGKTVGIVGCGRIGKTLAKILRAFDCDVIGYDTAANDCEEIIMTTLDAVLDDSDVVTLHMPYSSENHYFMDSEKIGRMKKTAFLINAGRGGLIDEEALLNALKNGGIAGAALDCFEQEPYKGPLSDCENVLLTGHIGSYAVEGRVMMERQAVNNLLNELAMLG